MKLASEKMVVEKRHHSFVVILSKSLCWCYLQHLCWSPMFFWKELCSRPWRFIATQSVQTKIVQLGRQQRRKRRGWCHPSLIGNGTVSFFFFLGGGKMLDDFGFKNVVLERWLPYHYVIIFHVYIYIYTYIYLCVVHMILGYYALKTVYHITLIYFQNFRRSSLLTKMIHYFISKG